VTLLAGGFIERGHAVTLVTLDGEDTDFYKLPERARRIGLAIAKNSSTAIHGLYNNIQRLKILRNAINDTQPDFVVSHINRTNTLTILALTHTHHRVIVVEHNNPLLNPSGRIWDALRRMSYPRAQKVVSVSWGVDSYFSWLAPEKRAVIHNPLALSKERAGGSTWQTDPAVKWIAAMGRLTRQKGFDLLLSAFSAISVRHPKWNLLILGEGELRRELEELRDKLGLANRVVFPGLVADPARLLRTAELFVMASRFEGFPYAALEAMASGLPVIYTDCPSGPREIIRHGIDGILVPNENVERLATAMDHLMTSEEERKRLALRAPDVIKRFSLERTISQWESLFNEFAGT